MNGNIKFYMDRENDFFECFNSKNGFYYRSKDKKGNVPIKRNFPELVDIGIMGRCHNKEICKQSDILCYQSTNQNDMTIEKYKNIVDQLENRTFQIALGGNGDPNKHKDFEEIVKYTRGKNIVPNLTTSGINLKSEEVSLISKFCGAVAISYHYKLVKGNYVPTNYTQAAINMLTSKCKYVNIHFVVSSKSIDAAIYLLEKSFHGHPINAVIFLLYKPIGSQKNENLILKNNEKLYKFLELVKKKYGFKRGY